MNEKNSTANLRKDETQDERTRKMKHYTTQTILASSILSILLSTGHAAESKQSPSLSDELARNLDCVIQPSEIIELGAPVSGVIEEIYVDRSDNVKKGELLVQLESDVERATANLAKTRATQETALHLREASLELGYLTLNRSKELLQNAAISKQDMDQVNTDLRIAELNLRQEYDNQAIAKMEYKRTEEILKQRSLKSPVDGVIIDRFKSIGELVDNDPVLSIAQIDPLIVEVIIPASQFGKVKTDMVAEVSPLVGQDNTHQATVTRVDQVIDASSSTFRVILNLPNPEYKISSGLRCKLNFVEDERQAMVSSN